MPRAYKPRVRRPLAERFLEKVQVQEDGAECWMWTAHVNNRGYGVFRIDAADTKLAHRWSYEFHVGPVPEGLVLDHFVCDTPRCVNPAHVRPVTQRENCLRGNGASSRSAAKTHCPQGHPYSGANLGVGRQGERYCRECKRLVKQGRHRRGETLNTTGEGS